MKAICITSLTICFLCLTSVLNAQSDSAIENSDTAYSDTSDDENERVNYFNMVGRRGMQKSLLLYNNPNKLPKFWLSTNIFAMWGWFYGPFTPLSLNVYYRTGSRSYVQLYDIQDAFKPADMRICATYNYKIFNKLKHRFVYQVIPGGDGINYAADLPINHYRSLDIGIGPAFDKQRYIGFDAPEMRNSAAVNNTRSMIKVGLSWTKSESFWMMLDNYKSGYYRRGRFYFDIYYLIRQKYTFQYNDPQPPGAIQPVPGISNIGYLAGFEKILGIKNSGFAIKFNVEFGNPPGFTQKTIGDLRNNTYFLACFGGIAWGPKPKIPRMDRIGK